MAARKPKMHQIAGSESRIAALVMRLHRTGKGWTLSQYLYASLGIAVAIAVLLFLRTGAPMLSLAVGLFAGAASVAAGAHAHLSARDFAIVFHRWPWGPGGAITFGNTILHTGETLESECITYEHRAGRTQHPRIRLGDHERAHVYQYMVLGPLFLPVYLLWLPGNLAAASWGAIALQGGYQGIVAALLAGGFYSYAVQKVGASEASMMLALVPAFTAIGAFLILDEALGLTTIIGIVVVSVGALLGALPPAALARLRGAGPRA